MEHNDNLKDAAASVARACQQALAWCSESGDDAVRADALLTRELRVAVVNAERLQYAAGAKMAVGVFGPSQAGKSYLISALARDRDGSVLSLFGDRQEDFLAKINPEGGKESTGLVTRFTYQPGALGTPDFPVQVGLLTEIDVVKILANSFAADVQHPDDSEPEQHQAEIDQAIAAARGLVRAGAGIAIEAVYDLEAYVNGHLGSNTRVKALRRFGFWQQAIELAPALGPEARVALFSTLWEQLPSYTDIYRRLQGRLMQLGGARSALCEPAVLFDVRGDNWQRSTQSIIDVATLSMLGEAAGDLVNVVAPNGTAVQLERAELAAVVSELRINLAHCPHPFFAHTDLLDFPGARSRQPQPRQRLGERDIRAENFLRGKVAYLFERYAEERELSAMLLCVGPSNQEVVGLGELIENWIELTHGATAADRSQVPSTLLFVLTKFDTAFEQSAGKGVDGTRWATRLEASLLKPFAAHAHRTDWVKRWDNRGPFKNTFWLRNPNFRQDALFAYGGAGNAQETSVRPDKQEFIATLRGAFLDNPLVHEHFAEPAAAWDEAMLLNDGGIMRIVKALAPICHPQVKANQVRQQLALLVRRVANALGRHYISADVSELRSEKATLAKTLLLALAPLLKRERLGELIGSLKLDDEAARAAFYQSEQAAIPDRATDKAQAAPEPDELDAETAALLGLAPVEVAPRPVAAERHFGHIFVETVIATWQAGVADLTRAPQVLNYYGVTAQHLLDIARELEVSARKTGLVDELAEDVRKNRSFRAETGTWRWRQTAPVTNRWNHFVDLAGHYPCNPSGVGIDTLQGARQVIFASRETATPMAALTETSADYEKTYLMDWLQGLQATVRTNADYLAGISGNVEANARLGDILTALRAHA
ncbi:MAG TPA: virulence factor SrfC family protein [Burkholderiaceae bacterium]|nr:virulence factor SrfC family protein [Burkholderiaceae bacterium]